MLGVKLISSALSGSAESGPANKRWLKMRSKILQLLTGGDVIIVTDSRSSLTGLGTITQISAVQAQIIQHDRTLSVGYFDSFRANDLCWTCRLGQ